MIPERVRWAVDHLALRPDDRVIEVGSGPGAAAELVCALVPDGWMLAVDRSTTACRRTRERNAAHLEAGRLEVRQSSLADLDTDGSFDHAFLVDVNVFWTGPAEAELTVLHGLLRDGGALHVVYGGGGPTPSDRVVDAVTRNLRAHGFHDVSLTTGGPAYAVCGRR